MWIVLSVVAVLWFCAIVQEIRERRRRSTIGEGYLHLCRNIGEEKVRDFYLELINKRGVVQPTDFNTQASQSWEKRKVRVIVEVIKEA